MQAASKTSPSAINRLKQLRLRSGPGALRRHEIRLIARIGDGFSFPPTSPPRHTKLAFAQRRLDARSPLHPAPQMRLEPQRLRAFEHGAQLRNAVLGALPDTHRPCARLNAPPLAATGTNDVIDMQPQRPRPLAARRASKALPRTAARKPPQMDADVLLDVAELDEERCCFSRDDAQRPQARD